eukprot:5763649-Karenia_brevis.AAC.1
MPGGREFKMIAQALRFMIDRLLLHWSVTNMSTASQEIRSEYIDLLKFGCSHTCIFCKCPMTCPTARTFDAGQAYE